MRRRRRRNKKWPIYIVIAVAVIYFYDHQEIKWQESFSEGSHIVIGVESKGDSEVDAENTAKIKSIFEYRLKEYGVHKKELIVEAVDEGKIVVQLPKVSLSQEIAGKLFASSVLEFKLVKNDPALLDAAFEGQIPPDLDLLFTPYGEEGVLLFKDVVLDGSAIKDARVEKNKGMEDPLIGLVFNQEGREKFTEFTGNHIGERLAIVLNGELMSAPEIKEQIKAGRAQITGRFTMEEANLLALILRSGAMPASTKLLESKYLTKEDWLGKQ